jgi:hypothetical protein
MGRLTQIALVAQAALGLFTTASAHGTHKQEGVNALYATKGEAEAAAKSFHCTGTHPMGTWWMPCAVHPGNQP